MTGIKTERRMDSRQKILSALKKNQPVKKALPSLDFTKDSSGNLKELFVKTLTSIGASVIEVVDLNEAAQYIKSLYPETSQIINTIRQLNSAFEIKDLNVDPHNFKNVTVAIMEGQFGVAENGAIWITDEKMGNRVLPYICEHLVLALRADSIVPTLHQAYELISNTKYNLGTFLAGPSKTADIEQSLVLGAHGSKSLKVFLVVD
jgi:L-lactate dehydrogenase complex protein LldG